MLVKTVYKTEDGKPTMIIEFDTLQEKEQFIETFGTFGAVTFAVGELMLNTYTSIANTHILELKK